VVSLKRKYMVSFQRNQVICLSGISTMSSNCPKGYWKAIMSEQEEALLNAAINETNN
jgi:hypothetical protein